MNEAESPDASPNGGPRGEASRLLDRLLVGVGGSEPSLAALRYALHLARGGSGRVEVLVVEASRLPIEAQMVHGDVLVGIVKEAERLLRSRWDDVQRRSEEVGREAGMPVSVRREQGRVSRQLVAAAEGCTLLVMGKRGCREEHGGLLGSNTELTLRKTTRPVLLAPDEFVPPRRVLAAHGGDPMGRAVLAVAHQVARALRAPMRVLFVSDDRERRAVVQEETQRHLASLGGSASFEAAGGSVARALIEHADRETVLVMGAFGHSRLYHLALGSTTEEVMRGAAGPVLLTGKGK